MANVIKAKAYHLVRRDTLENWVRKNPVLKAGEICLVTDAADSSRLIKICGKDNTSWSDLDYFSPAQEIVFPTVDKSYSPESENAQSGKAVAEALKNIDVSGIDVSGKMDKFGTVTSNGTKYTVEARDAHLNLQSINAISASFSGVVNMSGLLLNNIASFSSTGANEYSNYNFIKGMRDLTSDDDGHMAANKNYVDNTVATAIGTIDTVLDRIIEMQNSILGGEA
ncbi:MAG: hypothetical protein IKK24_03485 [Clostridia bacterium]|nr:hypothetical protein [Clostridia bacterium]